MAVEIMQCGKAEFVSILTVQQGKRRILVSSRALRSFMAARFAAGELYRKLAGMSATEKTNGLNAQGSFQAAV